MAQREMGVETNRFASSISFLNSDVSISNCFKVFSASNFVALLHNRRVTCYIEYKETNLILASAACRSP